MPTSIWSFVVRESMEPFLLRKANDDRRLSIGASQARHKDCRASRPLISMAKAGIRHEALFATGLPNRDIPHRAMSIERLEPCEGKLSRTVLRGPERVTARAYPVRRPAGLGFLRALCDSVVVFHHGGTEATESFEVGCRGRPICFRVFRVFRGYIPSAVAVPTIAAVLRSLAGDI
jgi:hypothetical protein